MGNKNKQNKLRLPYTRVTRTRVLLPNVRFAYYPLIWIGIFRPPSSIVKVEAYIDSGSEYCLFNPDYCKQLGIKMKEGIPMLIQGVGGKEPQNTAYFHDAELLVFQSFKRMKLKDAFWRIPAKVGFLEKPIKFAGILGVYGFLDHFSINLNVPKGEIELEYCF